MPVVGVGAQIGSFLREVTLHPAADRGIKLGQVTDFQIRPRPAPGGIGASSAARFLGVLGQVTFGVERGGAAVPGRPDRLAVHVVRHVAGRENPGHGRGRAARLEQIALGVDGQFAGERLGVRLVPDGDEHAPHGQFALAARWRGFPAAPRASRRPRRSGTRRRGCSRPARSSGVRARGPS